MADEILHEREVEKGFGGILAVDRCSIAVDQGEIVGLIGPNGAGKSTFFDLISGFVQPDAGSIAFRGEEIVGLPAHRDSPHGPDSDFSDTAGLDEDDCAGEYDAGSPGADGGESHQPA